MLGSHEDDIVRALPRNRYVSKIKRLRVNVAIGPARKEFAERVGVDIGRGQNCLVGICPCPRVIVVVSEDIDLPQQRERDEIGYQGDSQYKASPRGDTPPNKSRGHIVTLRKSLTGSNDHMGL